jgi:hypothetical protein
MGTNNNYYKDNDKTTIKDIKELLKDSNKYFDDALEVFEECKLSIYKTRNPFILHFDVMSLLNSSQI